MKSRNTYVLIGGALPLLLAMLYLLFLAPFFGRNPDWEWKLVIFAAMAIIPAGTVGLYQPEKGFWLTPWMGSLGFIVAGIAVTSRHGLVTFAGSPLGQERVLVAGVVFLLSTLWGSWWGILAQRAAASRSVAIN